MRLQTSLQSKKEENLIPLINIVFLILIFFLAASVIRPFSDRDIKLAEVAEAESPGSVVRMILIRADGTMLVNGQEVSAADLEGVIGGWSDDQARPITIIADRAATASSVVKVTTLVNGFGRNNVKLLMRKGR